MITLYDLNKLAEKNNIKTSEINIWICKKRKDKALEKTFGTTPSDIKLDKDNDIRLLIR